MQCSRGSVPVHTNKPLPRNSLWRQIVANLPASTGIYATIYRSGSRLLDALIGQLAVSLHLPLYTFNHRHFSQYQIFKPYSPILANDPLLAPYATDRAAKSNHRCAASDHFQLAGFGLHYAQGQGVNQDYAKASGWLKKAEAAAPAIAPQVDPMIAKIQKLQAHSGK